MSILNEVLGDHGSETIIKKQYNSLVNLWNNHTLQADSKMVTAAIATESLTEVDRNMVRDKLKGSAEAIKQFIADKELIPAIESATEKVFKPKVEGFSFGNGGTPAQVGSALAGLMLGADPSMALEKLRARDTTAVTLEVGQLGTIIPASSADSVINRMTPSIESYDESDIRNSAVYSIIFNANSSRQDEFGETLFPTLVQAPDQVGFTVSIDLQMVMDEITHKVTGELENWNMRNIIRSLENPNILKKDLTRIIPPVREENKAILADPADVAPYTVVLDGEEIETAPYRMGVTFDLMGATVRDSILEKGVPDNTDSLDRMILLKAIYFKSKGGDVIKFNTLNLPTNNFVYAQQGNWRNVALNFNTTSLLITEKTKQVDNTALVDLAGVATSKYNVRVSAWISGQVNLETGECRVFSNNVEVHNVTNEDGEQIALDTLGDLVESIQGGQFLYYDLEARKSNTNIRQRGQLINNQRYYQKYEIALRSPFTSLHPINTGVDTDTSDIEKLVTAVQFSLANEAVTELINAKDILASYVNANDLTGNPPDLLGVGRYLIIPTYYEDTIKLEDVMDSIKSHERALDVQAALVCNIRYYLYKMYVDSQYKAAANYLNGGVSPNPTVVIATDPEIARYLLVPGDIRTLGNEFDLRIVTTLDRRVKGKMFVTFTNMGEQRNTTVDPLSFGNLVYSPEVVISANISRNGQISKETMVQPRYRFVTHLPLMAFFNVTGLDQVMLKKSVVQTKEVV